MLAVKKFKKVLRKETSIYRKYMESFIKKIDDIIEQYKTPAMNYFFDGMKLLDCDAKKMETIALNAGPEKILGDELFHKLRDETSDYGIKVNELEKAIKCYQEYVQALDNDKAISPLYLGTLLSILFEMYANNHLTIEEISQILGMVVVCNAKYPERKDYEYCLPFLDYYNEDGTFKNNEDVEGYVKALNSLCNYFEEELENLYHVAQIFILEETVPEIRKESLLADEESLLPDNENRYFGHFKEFIPLFKELLEKNRINNGDVGMSPVTKLKTKLKKDIVRLKEYLTEYETKYEEARKSANKTFHNWLFDTKAKLNLSYKQLHKLEENIDYRIVFGEEEYDRITNEKNELENKQDALKAYMGFLQSIINSFEEDKVKNPLPIDDLLNVFLDAYCVEMFGIDDLSKFLGMVVVCNAKNLDEDSNGCYKPFLEYYNADGTFKYNQDLATFKNILMNLCEFAREIIRKKNENKNMRMVCETVPEIASEFVGVKEGKQELYEKGYLGFNDLLMPFADLLDENNKKIETQVAPKNASVQQKVVAPEELDKLRKYYRNKKLVAVPEDMDEFLGLLDRCGLDETEIKYILDLIREVTVEENKDEIAKYLDGNDLIIYEKAKKILENIRYTDPDYYMVVDSFELLKPICGLLAETFDEDLMEEKKNIMLALNDFNNRHEKTEIISLNNLIFLDKDKSTYLAHDLDKLGTVPRNIGTLLSKIKKNNQRNFRRVINSANLEYTPYEVTSNGISIFFVEVDAGIYVVVGCASAGSAYKKIITRVSGACGALKEIEETVKNPKLRNGLLTKHEKIFDDYNSKTRGLQRKKT